MVDITIRCNWPKPTTSHLEFFWDIKLNTLKALNTGLISCGSKRGKFNFHMTRINRIEVQKNLVVGLNLGNLVPNPIPYGIFVPVALR